MESFPLNTGSNISMNSQLKVSKRDGRQESLDLEKIHKVVTWAADGLDKVSVSEVELKAHLQFFDGIQTSEIHETLIKAAADLISEDAPDTSIWPHG